MGSDLNVSLGLKLQRPWGRGLETARKRRHGVTDAVRELAAIVQPRHSHLFRTRPLGAREYRFSTKLFFLFSFLKSLSKDFFSPRRPPFSTTLV